MVTQANHQDHRLYAHKTDWKMVLLGQKGET